MCNPKIHSYGKRTRIYDTKAIRYLGRVAAVLNAQLGPFISHQYILESSNAPTVAFNVNTRGKYFCVMGTYGSTAIDGHEPVVFIMETDYDASSHRVTMVHGSESAVAISQTGSQLQIGFGDIVANYLWLYIRTIRR